MIYEESERPAVQVELETADRKRWVELSLLTRRAAAGMNPTGHNVELEAEAARTRNSPAAPAYLLWSAENTMRQGHFGDSLGAFDRTIDAAEHAGPLVEGMDFIAAALHHKAAAATHDYQIDLAISTYLDLSARTDNPAAALLEAGMAAESIHRFDQAKQLYENAANHAGRRRPGDPGQQAGRAFHRLADSDSHFSPALAGIVNLLSEALEDRDGAKLEALASHSHFAVGLGGAHLIDDSRDVLQHLTEELRTSTPQRVGPLLGTGDKRYLFTRGWEGEWFRGQIGFLFLESGRGWQWSGIVLSQATDPWIERWRPRKLQTNQPLTFDIGAPWPAGKKFTAGGLNGFIAKEAAIAAAAVSSGVVAGVLLTPLGGVLVGAGVAAAMTEAFSLADCGFGIRGFYYNTGPTHDEEDAFAIDFTTYRRGLPYDNESGGTPVLAVADGIVQQACSGVSSGNSSASNTVEILHPDPASGTGRYLSRYLHLAGPSQVLVSMGMAVQRGDRLGLMNDTGNSAIDHLHFSIHDQSIPFPGAGGGCGSTTPRGASVRPTPMDGQSLNDDDDGKCVRSHNNETGSIRTTEGKITYLRVHQLGSGFGPPSDFIDAELIVRLDSAPEQNFGIPLRRGKRQSAYVGMFDLLLDAFAADADVKLEFERTSPTGREIIRTTRTS